MTAALWLGTYLLHSTVLYVAVLLVRRKLRRLDAAEGVWRAAALLPLVSATAAQLSGGSLWTLGIRPPIEPLNAAGLAAPASSVPGLSTVAPALAIACLAVGVVLVCRDWVARRIFIRGLGVRRPATESLMAVVADVVCRADLRRPICVTVSSAAASPMALGRSEICLPSRAEHDLTPRQCRVLIAHEVAHLVRHDTRWFTVLAWLESALFIQPLNRMARRELRRLAELSCDQWAARELSDADAMADCLVEVAGWSRTAPPLLVPGAVGPSGLTERVRRLLEEQSPAAGPSRTVALTVVLAASLSLPAVVISTPTRPAPAGLSPQFVEGYELGRRHAESRGEAGWQISVSRGQNPQTSSRPQWRADLERQLQARRSAR